jgi:hypothetical protein
MSYFTAQAVSLLTAIVALTITALPVAHANPRDDGLVAYWSFDEGSGGVTERVRTGH